MPRIFLLAGEPSGDLYAGLVARALTEAGGSVVLQGVGGNEMRAAGVDLREDCSRLSVFGFWEGLRSSGSMQVFRKRMRDYLKSSRPDVFVPVSFSGVNLGLASYARRLGIRVVYLSPPQLWAWGRWRARALRGGSDKVVCLLPFEEKFLRSLGIDAVYVGNPLVDHLKPQRPGDEASEGEKPQVPSLVLMAGSRQAEVARHLPLMQEVAVRLQRDSAGLEVQILGSFTDGQAEPSIPDHSVRWRMMSGATVIIAASGTATLEAALLGVPMVVLYRLSFASYLAARAVVRLKYFSLPNLILGRGTVPEFLQPSANQVYLAAKGLLSNPGRAQKMRLDLTELRAVMGKPGAAKRIAGEILG